MLYVLSVCLKTVCCYLVRQLDVSSRQSFVNKADHREIIFTVKSEIRHISALLLSPMQEVTECRQLMVVLMTLVLNTRFVFTLGYIIKTDYIAFTAFD